MDEFDLFAAKSKKANCTNSSIRSLGESMARQSAFEIIWPLGATWGFLRMLGMWDGPLGPKPKIKQNKDAIALFLDILLCFMGHDWKGQSFFLLKDSNKGLFEYMLSSAFERFERLKELNFHAKNVYMGCQEATRLKGIQLLRGQKTR